MSFSTADRSLLVRAAEALGRELSEPMVERLARYAELVALWNARVNLTGARTPEALVDVLFADALVLSDPELIPPDTRLIDVGAGAGAPALPLAILRPDLRVTLLEPLRKRVAFIRNVIGTLDLAASARADERRLEGSPIEGAPFDVAMSRATFEPAVWLPKGFNLAPQVVVLAGAEGLPSAEGTTRVVERDYALPFGGSPRHAGRYACE